MAYWSQTDLENALSVSTVLALYDDTNTGVVSATALTSVQARSDQEVNSYIATNYPNLTLPLTSPPDTIKFASLEFGIVFSRDRKPEYWAESQGRERESRLKEARAKMDRFAQGQQYIYDAAAEKKPTTVGGIVVDDGRRVISDDPDGTDNAGDFG